MQSLRRAIIARSIRAVLRGKYGSKPALRFRRLIGLRAKPRRHAILRIASLDLRLCERCLRR
jgi:hypothetical protein